jgi:ABC-type nitrate/sulfonate/bicarbonate transport system substrate-binding protein
MWGVAEDWFGVRCFFRHVSSVDGGTYEERVTLWAATDFEAAIRLAEAEAEEYTKDLDCEYLGMAQAYRLDARPGQGAEVFSLMRDSPMEPGDYLSAYFDTGDERQQAGDD